MKRFYNNTKMSGAFSNVLRVLALLCVLLGVSSSAWAGEAGFFKDAALHLWFQNATAISYDNAYKCNQSGMKSFSLGTNLTTAPTFIADAYVFKKNGGNICTVKLYANYDGVYQGEIADFKYDNEWDDTANNSKNQKWNAPKVNLPASSGSHTIQLWASATGGNDGGCATTYLLNNNNGTGNGYYEFTYSIKSASVSKIYVYGDAFGTNDKQECLPTANNPNIVYKELKNWSQWFRFTNSSTDDNWNFYQSTEHTKGTSKGVTLGGIPKDGNSLQASNMQENYNTPVFFYYNLSTKEYWVEASKAASYSIEFANGKTYGCYGVSEGTQCGPHVVELGEGTHQFKVKKSDVVYQYATEITQAGITKQVLTKTDAYSTITIPEGEFYSCSFTINDEGGSMKLTVSCTKKEEPILLSKNPVLSNNNKTVTLSAYLQKTLCPTSATINQYGFAISSGAGSIPNESSKRIGSSTAPIFRGSDIVYTTGIDNATDRLIGGITYGYRAYVIIDGILYLSRETYYFRLDGDCIPQAITGPNAVSEVNYTIDASLGEDYEDDCKLIYGSLQKAIDALKATSEKEEEFRYAVKSKINDDYTYNLQVPVIFNINYYDNTPDDPSKAYCYEGTNKAKISGGGSSSEESYALIFKDFNREKVGEQKLETLTIKGASGSNRPWLHHVILRNSRNVVLDNLAIYSDPTGERTDDALEFDLNNGAFWDINVNTERDHNILVKNCMIGSNGFTGLHASGYDGITFENNEFEAIMATSKDSWTQNNAIGWGASAKFMMCSNIKFVRNNFRGAHATLVWLQECQNVLFMNNVFWNTNQYNASGCAAIRLVAQYNRDVLNHAYLYNTFYLADNENKNHYNFFKFDLKLGSDGQSGKKENYDTEKIYFKYNNCYSYDKDITGRSDDPFEGLISTINGSENFCPNNFWSVRDQGIYDTKTEAEKATFKSGFAFGNACDKGTVKQFVNVKELVCATTATGPASLKIKGGGELKRGSKLVADEENFFGTGIGMTQDELNYDRYNAAIRPAEGDWTLGAYEAQDEVLVKKIYWIGLTDEWDDRNNWGYYPEDVVATSKNQVEMAAARAADMQRLSCVNNLTEELHVVIPEHPLVQLDGGRKWPKVPESFTSGRLNYDNGEHVNAGAKSGVKGSKFADVIEIEYGAAIKGVEHLTTNYGSAIVHFTAPRDKWILVGTVVEPFDEDKKDSQTTRKVKSGDYFIDGRTPNVYMHQAEIVDGKPVWKTTFSQLDEEIDANEVFAIMIPNQYGYFKLPAAYYNTDREENPSGKIYDPAQPIVYGEYEGSKGPFQGKLVNDKNENGDYPISFTGLKTGLNLLNNSYPYNIDAKKVENLSKKGSIQYFNPDAGEFMNTSSTGSNVILKPQHGFIFTPNSEVSRLDITNKMLDDGNTRSRSAEIELPTFSLNLYNANNNVNYSNAVVRYDEFLGEGNKSNLDVEKAFSPITKTPGLYIIANDGQYSRVDVATTSKAIPLGLRIQEPMIVRFEKSWFSGFSKVTLYDDWTKKEIDLLSKTYTTEELPVGDMEGRFFLYLEEITKEDEDLEDDDVTTEVEEEITSASEINIFVDNSDNTIKVITNGMELRTIFVSDMAGRTMKFDVRGYAVNLNLPVSQGVYMIHVVGDGGSRTEKVVLK